MPDAVEVRGLSKRFGETVALHTLDLNVPEGAVLGLLGPNGAGKTTSVRILTTLLQPDAGEARVAGFDVIREPARVRAAIGLTGQDTALDPFLTGRENLAMIGELNQLRRAEARSRADELLSQFDLADAADRRVGGYSGGMVRRLDLAASLIGRPAVLFLDEPTTGLDPRGRHAMWEVIQRLVAQGATLLLTTQYLEEADVLADRIAVIDHGRLIAEGTAEDLKAQVGGEVLELHVVSADQLEAARATLQPLLDGNVTVAESDQRLTIPIGRDMGLFAEVVRQLREADIEFADIAVHGPNLDDVFFALTGAPTQVDEAGSESGEEAR